MQRNRLRSNLSKLFCQSNSEQRSSTQFSPDTMSGQRRPCALRSKIYLNVTKVACSIKNPILTKKHAIVILKEYILNYNDEKYVILKSFM